MDAIASALDAVSSGKPSAFPWVFMAGIVSSSGPCVTPRLIAIAGVGANQQRRRAIVLVLSFIAGLVAMYASFGTAASLLGRVIQLSGPVYAIVAAALAVCGMRSLWKGEPSCGRNNGTRLTVGSGGAFFLGASFAFVVSPCCTPLVFAILGYSMAARDPAYGSGLLACFALGHALPVTAAAAGAEALTQLFKRCAVPQAASVVSATLMLAFAAYYAVLA